MVLCNGLHVLHLSTHTPRITRARDRQLWQKSAKVERNHGHAGPAGVEYDLVTYYGREEQDGAEEEHRGGGGAVGGDRGEDYDPESRPAWNPSCIVTSKVSLTSQP